MTRFPIGRTATLPRLEHDPHPLLARLRTAEPVSWLPALDGWLVTRYDLAVRVLSDPATFTVDDPRFSTARVVGPSMLSLDGAEHARHREPFGAPLRPVRARFGGFAEAAAGRLISALRPAGRVELRRDVTGPFAAAVITEALGLSDVDSSEVLSWYTSIVESVSDLTAGRPPGTWPDDTLRWPSSTSRSLRACPITDGIRRKPAALARVRTARRHCHSSLEVVSCEGRRPVASSTHCCAPPLWVLLRQWAWSAAQVGVGMPATPQPSSVIRSSSSARVSSSDLAARCA